MRLWRGLPLQKSHAQGGTDEAGLEALGAWPNLRRAGGRDPGRRPGF